MWDHDEILLQGLQETKQMSLVTVTQPVTRHTVDSGVVCAVSTVYVHDSLVYMCVVPVTMTIQLMAVYALDTIADHSIGQHLH